MTDTNVYAQANARDPLIIATLWWLYLISNTKIRTHLVHC